MSWFRSLHPAAILLLLVGLVLRLWVAIAAADVLLVLDGIDYVKRADFLRVEGHLPDAFRPPFFPMLLGALRAVFGEGLLVLRVAQALIGMAGGLVLFRWLEGLAGTRGALVSLALYALYPTFVGFTHLVWTETTFLVLLIAFFAASMRPGELPLRRAALSGLIYGVGILTRSMLLPLAPLAALLVLVRPLEWGWRPQRGLRLAIFLGTIGLTVAPWTAHNRVVTGRWTVVEITHGYNLWKGNTPVAHPLRTDGPRLPGPLVSVPMFPYEGSLSTIQATCADQLGVAAEDLEFPEMSDCAQGLALGHIVADLPAFLGRGVEKLGFTFHPSSLLTRILWMGGYGAVPGWAVLGLIHGTAAGLGLVILLGAWGGLRSRTLPITALLGLFSLAQLGVVFVTFGNPRFRLPIVLVGMIFAAWLPRARGSDAD